MTSTTPSTTISRGTMGRVNVKARRNYGLLEGHRLNTAIDYDRKDALEGLRGDCHGCNFGAERIKYSSAVCYILETINMH